MFNFLAMFLSPIMSKNNLEAAIHHIHIFFRDNPSKDMVIKEIKAFLIHSTVCKYRKLITR